MERPLVKTTGSEQLDNVKRQVPLDLQKCINHRTAAVLGESSEMLERKPECRINRSLELGFQNESPSCLTPFGEMANLSVNRLLCFTVILRRLESFVLFCLNSLIIEIASGMGPAIALAVQYCSP